MSPSVRRPVKVVAETPALLILKFIVLIRAKYWSGIPGRLEVGRHDPQNQYSGTQLGD
jgi:hypothetical protein